MLPSELSYLAGFIDGEGSFIICKRLHTNEFGTWKGYSLFIDIGNTNLEVLQWIKNKTGNTSEIYINPQKGNRKQMYRMRINAKLSKKLAEELLPYLIVKREQADVFLKFPFDKKRLNSVLKEQLFQEMKKLNFRGIGLTSKPLL